MAKQMPFASFKCGQCADWIPKIGYRFVGNCSHEKRTVLANESRCLEHFKLYVRSASQETQAVTA